jgi:major intracellular serine protease
MNKTFAILMSALLVSTPCYSKPKTIKVAVIDTGLDRNDHRFKNVLCKDGHFNFVNNSTDTTDNNGHGTHIAGLIKQHAGVKGYCLVILKYFDNSSKDTLPAFIKAVKHANSIGANIVNFSGGGSMFEIAEFEAIKQASKVKFIVAAGNNGSDISSSFSKFYPASYDLPNVMPVGNLDQSMQRAPSSNFGDSRIIWEVGTDLNSTAPCKIVQKCEAKATGTSQATAVYTGKMIRGMMHGY